MLLIWWLALGALGGLTANIVADGRRASRVLNMALGCAGAVGGGFMFWSFGGFSLLDFNGHSMVVAAIGAAVVLLTYHALFVYPGDGRD